MSAVVNFLQRDSWIHRLNPLTKLGWSLLVMTLSFIFQEPLSLLVLFAFVVLVAYAAGVLKEMLPVFKGISYCAVLFLLFQIFFITEGQTVLTLLPGLNWLRITDQGLLISLGIGLRLLVVASSFPVLLATTQVKDLVTMLVEKLKIPYTYAFMFITTLRFIPTFIKEMDQIIQAQSCRAYRLNQHNFITKFRSIIPVALPLLITSVKKAELMAISMETRGFGLGKRTCLHQKSFTRADFCVGLILTGVGLIGFASVFKGIWG